MIVIIIIIIIIIIIVIKYLLFLNFGLSYIILFVISCFIELNF